MMRARTVVPVLVAALLGIAWSSAVARGPSTPREREKAVKLIRQLEQDPWFPGSREARTWLSLWLLDVPDLRIDLCPELLGGTAMERKRFPAEVVTQTLYSGTAFLIENPGKAKAREEIYLAGLTGALLVYEAMLRDRPHLRTAPLDALLARRDAGTLPAWVAEAMKSCAPAPGA